MVSQRERTTRGFSLLEMAAASVIVAGSIVPALALVRDAMATSRDLHRRNLLANYAIHILEERIAIVATNWSSVTTTGDFAADGHADIRFSATTSDDPSDGGITGQLMSVEVTVYDDQDADDSLDTGELRETYRTKIAKLNNYENEEQ